MVFSKFNVNIFIIEAVFFIASFAVGIISTLQIDKIVAGHAEIAKITAKLPPGSVPSLSPELENIRRLNTPEFITFDQFIISFALATLFFVILTKTKYGGALFRTIFYLALFAGTQVIFQIWINQQASILIAAVVVLTRYFFPNALMHNIAIIAAITGISINLGMNTGVNQAILILIAISVYDWLAVYVTGHMVKMLKDTISTGTIFAMIIPSNIRDMMRTVSSISQEKNEAIKSGLKSEFVYLGGGDLAFPMIMVIAALRVGLSSAIFTAIGALFGLLALNIIFAMQKEKKPMAALPPLAAFSILGFIASLIRF